MQTVLDILGVSKVEFIKMAIDIIFGGGIIIYVFAIYMERRLKKQEKERVKKAIQELFEEEVKENLRVLNYINATCNSKYENPKVVDFISGDFYFNVLDYILDNLIELNIEKAQMKNLMAIKTSLKNVLFWQDEYVLGTKGRVDLMFDTKVMEFYFPKIQLKTADAKTLLESSLNLFSRK